MLAKLGAGRLQPVERDQAAGRGLVLAGAEGAAGVDLERDGAGGTLVAMRGRVDEEAAGADRLQPAAG